MITSIHNPVVKYVRSLERTSVRREEGAYVAEGVRLVGEALASGQHASIVLYDPDALSRTDRGDLLSRSLAEWAERYYAVDARVLRAATNTETPQGVLAVLKFPEAPPLASQAPGRFGLLLDRLADPGNAGTILRTAHAAGVGYVCALPGTVDLFAPKVVRAGMGAHFRLPIYRETSWEDVDRALAGAAIVLTDIEVGQSIYDLEWPESVLLVVGSEAHGVSEEARRRASLTVHVPMRPGVESLNASVAASIVIYSALGPRIPAG